MTKKPTKPAKPTKKTKGGKKTKAEQLKIPGTGRIDAIEEVETQAEAFLAAREAWAEMQGEMGDERTKLTKVIKKHGITEYIFIDKEGCKRRVYIPLDAEAKVAKVKTEKPAKDEDDGYDE